MNHDFSPLFSLLMVRIVYVMMCTSHPHAFNVLSGNEFKGSWFLSCGFIIQYLIYASLYSSSYFYTIFQWLSSFPLYSSLALCVCVFELFVLCCHQCQWFQWVGEKTRSGLNFYYYSHRRITGRYFADWGKFIVCGKRVPCIHPSHTASYNQKSNKKEGEEVKTFAQRTTAHNIHMKWKEGGKKWPIKKEKCRKRWGQKIL